MLTFGGADPNTALREILAALNRLLQPGMGDSAALYVGQVISLQASHTASADVYDSPGTSADGSAM